MHLKFAYANIHSKLFFPMDFLPIQCYIYMCAPTKMVVLIFELTETPASSEQRVKKTSKKKSQMCYFDHPTQR